MADVTATAAATATPPPRATVRLCNLRKPSGASTSPMDREMRMTIGVVINATRIAISPGIAQFVSMLSGDSDKHDRWQQRPTSPLRDGGAYTGAQQRRTKA